MRLFATIAAFALAQDESGKFKIIKYGTNIFPRTQAETGTECPDYLEYFKVDVRCKDYEEEDP